MLPLAAHPQSSNVPALALSARVTLAHDGALAFNYVLEGDLAGLRIPLLGTPRYAELLWQHTCFEAFARVPGQPSYYEFNFAPSREWAAFTFGSYRDRQARLEQVDPIIDVRTLDRRLELDAVVAFERLPNPLAHRSWSIGLSAVIETSEGHVSYWALRHPSGRPDFHHPDAFAYELAPLTAQGTSLELRR